MIRWQGLSYAYAGGHGGIGFDDQQLPAGGKVLLHGPSGSGKSTLLALLAGLLTPTTGQIEVAGQDLSRLSGRALDHWRGETIGMLPQRLHLSDSLSVEDNLAMPFLAAALPVDRARIAELLQRLGLAGLGQRRPAQLSVGQAQRVALARALMRRPKLILADEPTAHLDDRSTRQALSLLEQVAGELGATLLIATHDSRLHDGRAMLLQLRPPQPVEAVDGAAA